MAIPASTLDNWSNQGATTASANTYASIKHALSNYDWPPGMTFNVYLQGSYPNHTNIRGDSDVDVVVQSDAVFYNNLSEEAKRLLNLSPGGFTFTDFKNHVVAAIAQYYGSELVSIGRKSVKISGSAGRLNADVVPCVLYRRYLEYVIAAEGMTFWTKDDIRIINYPKLHISNGSTKNASCSGRYKPTVRMLKNARNALNETETTPSYFLECLMYNVTDNCFQTDPSSTFTACLEYLLSNMEAGLLSTMTTGSRQHYLFGDDEVQWDQPAAERFINAIARLWINA